MPLPGASAIIVPLPTASVLAVWRVSLSNRKVSINAVPTYAGFAPDSSGRTLDHAPSAPTSRSVVTVAPFPKLTSCLPPPTDTTATVLCPHRTIPAGSDSSSIRRSSPRGTSGRPPLPLSAWYSSHLAVLVENALRLRLRLDQPAKLRKQPRRLQRQLPVVFVDIQQPSLPSRVRRALRFIDHRGNPMHMQHPRQHQPAQPRPNNRYFVLHPLSLSGSSLLASSQGLDHLSGTSFHNYGMTFQTCQDKRMVQKAASAGSKFASHSPKGASLSPKAASLSPKAASHSPQAARPGAKAASNRTSTSQRREEALSRERIIHASIDLLDADGESGLTFRTLADRLATGPGAIYWHIANKGELLTAACDAIIARTLDLPSSATPLPATAPGGSPQADLRLLALAMFDAIDAHPWVGAALTRAPGQLPTIRIVERLGRHIQALGVPVKDHWITTSALLNYILGVAGRNAANGQLAHLQGLDRSHFLNAVSTAWSQLDPTQYAFARSLATHLRAHDDRLDFLAGIDLILHGILRPQTPDS